MGHLRRRPHFNRRAGVGSTEIAHLHARTRALSAYRTRSVRLPDETVAGRLLAQ
jgi:hypothetical protein